MHLRQVIELAGAGRHCDFTPVEGYDRTDLALQLPGNRFVAVDAKAPVGAYLESLRLAGEDERERKLEEHSVSLRGHVEHLMGLAQGEGRKPEFTVAYVPNEAFLSAALERQPGLIEEAAARQIFFASPATLIALLKVAAHGWQQEQLADQARQVRELGRTLYERLCGFVNEMEGVSENLSHTVASYNRAVGTLENRVLRGARRFAGVDQALELTSPSPVNTSARTPVEEPEPVADAAPIAEAVFVSGDETGADAVREAVEAAVSGAPEAQSAAAGLARLEQAMSEPSGPEHGEDRAEPAATRNSADGSEDRQAHTDIEGFVKVS
jgi:DNA recombination protein RmuC